jgi:hypothetical protein
MLVLMFFVLFVPFALLLLVTPSPIIPLVLRSELIVIHVIAVTLRHPLAVRPVFARIPVVIVAILLVIGPPVSLFLFVPFVLVLGSRHGHCAYWRYQRSR